jgi:hypothetical protein
MKSLIEIDLVALRGFANAITQHSGIKNSRDGHLYSTTGDDFISISYGVIGGGAGICDVNFKIVEPNKELIIISIKNHRKISGRTIMIIYTEYVEQYHLTLSEEEFQKLKRVLRWTSTHSEIPKKVINRGDFDIYQDSNDLIEEIRKYGKYEP